MPNHLTKHSILNYLHCGVFVVDTSLQLIFANQTAETIVGKSLKQLMGRSLNEIFDSKPLQAHIQLALNHQQGSVVRNCVMKLTNGQQISTNYSTNPWHDNDKMSGVIIEFNQVDRQLRIEKEARLVNQHKTNQTLLRGLAHEIKNPLGGLRGAAQLLENEFSDIEQGKELKEYTNIIISEADRLKKLVDRMLGTAEITQMHCINIHQVFEHVYQLACHNLPNNICISRDYDPSIPNFNGDSEQLIQVALNILNNAIKELTVPDQDSIVNTSQHLSITPFSSGNILLKTRVARNFTISQRRYPLVIKAEIIDNGPGVPAELQDKLFFPMISGYADGTGLGLSIAQSLVHLHNGLIECDSQPGNTCFRILIPITGDCR